MGCPCLFWVLRMCLIDRYNLRSLPSNLYYDFLLNNRLDQYFVLLNLLRALRVIFRPPNGQLISSMLSSFFLLWFYLTLFILQSIWSQILLFLRRTQQPQINFELTTCLLNQLKMLEAILTLSYQLFSKEIIEHIHYFLVTKLNIIWML